MSLPDLLAETVGDESVVAEVSLGGDDRLVVTPTRTLVYRGDGLLSDESVAEFSHGVERIAISTGRRKAKLTLGYGLDGDETVSVPAKRVDEVLHPILAGVLSATDVTAPGESVVRTFRFSELTLVVTSDRLVKHVGSAVWDDEFEEFSYADLTDLHFEEGTVATAVVLAHDGRSERFKAPNESARAVRETLVDAVCAFHDVDSLEEFRVTVADDEEDGAEADTTTGTGGTTDFGEGPDPLSASPVADAEAESGAGAEPEPGAGAEPEPGLDSGGTDEWDADSERSTSAESPSASTSDPETAPDAPTADERATTTEEQSGQTGSISGSSDPLSAGIGDAEAASTGSTPSTETMATEETSTETTSTEAASTTNTGTEPSRSETDATAEPAVKSATEPIGEEPFDASDVDLTSDVEEGDSADADAFDGSPFESAGIEGEDLATEVVALRRTVEAQSEQLDRQSSLIEQLIEELRRGR